MPGIFLSSIGSPKTECTNHLTMDFSKIGTYWLRISHIFLILKIVFESFCRRLQCSDKCVRFLGFLF